MCELVEQYAQETARETARMFLLNGASYEMAQKSVKSLTKEELDAIYAETQDELKKESISPLILILKC